MAKRIGAAIVALVLGTSLTGCWLQPRNGAGRTNWNRTERELHSGNVPSLAMAWEAYTFGQVNPPISVGGVVYVTTRNGRAAAFATASGDPLWHRDFYDGRIGAAPTLGSPAWHDGELLVPAMNLAGGGGLLRLDPADGSTVGGGLDGEATAAVAVAGGQVATMAGTPTSSGFGTAQVSWKFRAAVAFDPYRRTGEDFAIVGERVMWSLGRTAQGFSSACPSYPIGWPVTGCAPDWSTDLGGQPTTPAAAGAGAVVYADDTGTVTVLDAADGSVRWTAEVGAPVSAPAVARDTILVAAGDGRLVAFAAGGCSASPCPPLWEGTLPTSSAAPPVVGGDVVYVGLGDHTIAAFAVEGCGADTCAPLTTVWAGESLSGPIVDDGLVIVGTGNGMVRAFGVPASP